MDVAGCIKAGALRFLNFSSLVTFLVRPFPNYGGQL